MKKIIEKICKFFNRKCIENASDSYWYRNLLREDRKSCIELLSRATGRTTRNADNIIQKLLTEPPMTRIVILDHYKEGKDSKANRHLMDIVRFRLDKEHPMVEYKTSGNVIYRTQKTFREKLHECLNDRKVIDSWKWNYYGKMSFEEYLMSKISQM